MWDSYQWLIAGLLSASGMWSIILYFIQRHDKRRDRAEAERDAKLAAMDARVTELEALQLQQNKAHVAEMHHTLYDACTTILTEYADGKRHWIDVEEMHDITVLYDAYRAMGGNGTCKVLYDKLLALPPKNTSVPR